MGTHTSATSPAKPLMDTGEWLHGLGLGQYVPAFRANDIDEEVLRGLTAEDLRRAAVYCDFDRP